MSTAEEPYLRERTLPQSGPRRAQQIVATATLALALIAAAAVALVDSMSGGDAQLLLVVVPSRHILGVATILAFVALSSMFWTLSLPSGWSAMVVIGRVLSIGGALIAVFWGVLTTPWPVTPLLIHGCESGYVVEERSFLFLSSITVLERHGLIATPVLGTSADDGYQPFAAGEYDAWVDDGHIEGWFALEPGSNPALSRFELPLSQSPHCG
ncbi:hypothetical protein SRABI76_02756 [Microbacterium oxydans]|uniref:hypothetical protein n=1 Tax=Microbacterium oxydans TaxID=82380 RepID=UPI001DBA33B9|nr:hypothetical protein [Microbacterium oxydans]CAH0231169.1 hypothetical protein SRABI76_02756 [Microbacterium oxydans]